MAREADREQRNPVGRLNRMEYKKLSLSCECGKAPKHVLSVGLSTTHELVVHWRCPRCGKNLYAVKALADCWRDCPVETAASLSTSNLAVDTFADRTFLHSLG